MIVIGDLVVVKSRLGRRLFYKHQNDREARLIDELPCLIVDSLRNKHANNREYFNLLHSTLGFLELFKEDHNYDLMKLNDDE